MTLKKKILHSIFTVIIIIEIIVLLLLNIEKELPQYIAPFFHVFTQGLSIVFIVFFVTVTCYIFEHKKHNKNENILDEDEIYPEFDIDFSKKDILYLSTILTQRFPNKKQIILLIMQLINKKVIDLIPHFDGTNYQYIIEKRNFYNAKITNVENELLNYLFKDCNSVNLIDKIKLIYSDKNFVPNIINSCTEYIENEHLVKKSPIKILYKIMISIEALMFFMLLASSLFFDAMLLFEKLSPFMIVVTLFTLGLFSLIGAFVFIFIFKKFNNSYQDTNDTYLWISKNIIFLITCFILLSIFSAPLIIHLIIITIYILSMFTIMIKYNKHISLSENDIITRNKLLALKKYLKEMNYMRNKEFGNIITYEEFVMYGFLFNITIKINTDFDILQKELYNIIKTETDSYFQLLNGRIL